jgi:hypothetical protein
MASAERTSTSYRISELKNLSRNPRPAPRVVEFAGSEGPLLSREQLFGCPDIGLLLRLLSGKADVRRLALSQRSMQRRFRQILAPLPKRESRSLEGSSFLFFEGSV